jgi:hypothetical protein
VARTLDTEAGYANLRARYVTFEDRLTSYDGAGCKAAADERWEGGFDPSQSLRGWKGKRVLDIRDVVEDV